MKQDFTGASHCIELSAAGIILGRLMAKGFASYVDDDGELRADGDVGDFGFTVFLLLGGRVVSARFCRKYDRGPFKRLVTFRISTAGHDFREYLAEFTTQQTPFGCRKDIQDWLYTWGVES